MAVIHYTRGELTEAGFTPSRLRELLWVFHDRALSRRDASMSARDLDLQERRDALIVGEGEGEDWTVYASAVRREEGR